MQETAVSPWGMTVDTGSRGVGAPFEAVLQGQSLASVDRSDIRNENRSSRTSLEVRLEHSETRRHQAELLSLQNYGWIKEAVQNLETKMAEQIAGVKLDALQRENSAMQNRLLVLELAAKPKV